MGTVYCGGFALLIDEINPQSIKFNRLYQANESIPGY